MSRKIKSGLDYLLFLFSWGNIWTWNLISSKTEAKERCRELPWLRSTTSIVLSPTNALHAWWCILSSVSTNEIRFDIHESLLSLIDATSARRVASHRWVVDVHKYIADHWLEEPCRIGCTDSDITSSMCNDHSNCGVTSQGSTHARMGEWKSFFFSLYYFCSRRKKASTT